MSVLDSFKRLIGDREPTAEEVNDARILGWMIEWLQAFFLVRCHGVDGVDGVDGLGRRGHWALGVGRWDTR